MVLLDVAARGGRLHTESLTAKPVPHRGTRRFGRGGTKCHDWVRRITTHVIQNDAPIPLRITYRADPKRLTMPWVMPQIVLPSNRQDGRRWITSPCW